MSGSATLGRVMLGLTSGLTLTEFPLPAWLLLPALLPLPLLFPAELPFPFPLPLPLPLPRNLFPLPAVGFVIEPTVFVIPESPSSRPRLKLTVLPLPAEFPLPA